MRRGRGRGRRRARPDRESSSHERSGALARCCVVDDTTRYGEAPRQKDKRRQKKAP